MTALPGDIAQLMDEVAARQAASQTAAVQAGFAPGATPVPFAPCDGTFNSALAAEIRRWRKE